MKRRTKSEIVHECSLQNPPSAAAEVTGSKCTRRFKRSIQIWDKCPRTREKFRSEFDIERERTRHISTHPWIIHPCSQFRTFYEYWMIFVILATLVFYPIYTAFPTQHVQAKFQVDLFIFALVSLMNVFDMVVTFWTGYIEGDTEVFARISERCVALWQCVIMSCSISHWVACIFFLTAKYRWVYSDYYPNNDERSWLSVDGINVSSPIGAMYLMSMYKSVSHLLSVKKARFYRSNRLWEEYLIEIVVDLFGRFFMGWITVLILEMFLSISRKEREYQETLTEITGYMCRKNVPELMQERVIRYYEYKFNRTVFRENKILDSLSDMLVAQVHLNDVATLIKNVSFFEKLGSGTLERISKHLKSEVFLENDVIIKAGQSGDCMYFILHGTVSVLTPAGEEVCHLQDGGHFGEICLILKNTLTNATVVAIERCTLYRLERKVFKTCIKDKAILDDIRQVALKRQAQVEEMMATSTAAKFEMDAVRQ